ncbi:hypothetical protein [Modestobacter sp. SYSU DS0290]
MSPRGAAALAGSGGAAIGLLAVLVGRLSGWALSLPVALAAGVAGGLLLLAGSRLSTADPAPELAVDPPEAATAASFGDLASLRFAVEQDSRDPRRFETRLRPRLVALATDRLWLRHGLDWRTPEGRAAATPLLGPALLALLVAPPHSLRSTPQAISDWTRDLEAL